MKQRRLKPNPIDQEPSSWLPMNLCPFLRNPITKERKRRRWSCLTTSCCASKLSRQGVVSVICPWWVENRSNTKERERERVQRIKASGTKRVSANQPRSTMRANLRPGLSVWLSPTSWSIFVCDRVKVWKVSSILFLCLCVEQLRQDGMFIMLDSTRSSIHYFVFCLTSFVLFLLLSRLIHV